MKRGLFITFEGLDGCGKSTQIGFLAEYLREKGFDVLTTREPGGCPVSEKIRGILLDKNNTELSAGAEALLYAAARTQLVNEVILPAVEEGKIVLCDRFFDSSVAYQGSARGLGEEWILSINGEAVRNCMPDLTIFLQFGPEESEKRRKKRGEKDRLENEDGTFFTRVYEGFLWLMDRYPERIVPVDVSGSKFETREKIREIADGVIAKWQD